MTSNPVTVRWSALAGPVLLLFYGVLRLLGGVFTNLGHLAFLVGLLVFALLVTGLRALVPPGSRRLATIAAGAALAGLALLCAAILADLPFDLRETPGVPETAGLTLFPVGALTLFGLLVAARRLPAWTPLLFGAGIALSLLELALLPAGALLILLALGPLRRHTPEPALRPRLASGLR
ncbi:hypothetical protein [Actinoplanes sp. NPDC051851]|uniref:hypothetical protein n=1 Tax=Actinoplanes sp. NPDC051851 TaxID=3154753 RepID=UPI00343EAF2A